MVTRVSPLAPAIEAWLSRIESEDPYASLADKWMRRLCLSERDLSLVPFRHAHNGGYFLGVTFCSFGRSLGMFMCFIQKGGSGIPVRVSAPRMSEHTPAELTSATILSLWKLVPIGTRLEVKIEDDLHANLSTLHVAELYTQQGWELDPARTQLVNENPRTWVFCFQKV